MQVTERTVGEVTVLDAQGRMALNDGHGAVKQRVGELLAAGRRQLVLDLGPRSPTWIVRASANS